MGSNLLPRPAQPATHQGQRAPRRVAGYTPRVATRVQLGVQLHTPHYRLKKAKRGALGSRGSSFFKNFSLWGGIRTYRGNNRDKLLHLLPLLPGRSGMTRPRRRLTTRYSPDGRATVRQVLGEGRPSLFYPKAPPLQDRGRAQSSEGSR